MGQKVHPKGFRLGFTQDHLSNWYASPKDYAQYVIQDNELHQKLFSSENKERGDTSPCVPCNSTRKGSLSGTGRSYM